jgi:hypothetical protein
VRQIKWSAGETAFLKMCVAKRFSRMQIARHFPHRSPLAIKAKIEWERRQIYDSSGHIVKARAAYRKREAASGRLIVL